MRRHLDKSEIGSLPEETEGQRLRKLRLSAELTQDKLSEELGFSTNYYGQVERGAKALSKNMADAVCGRFDVSYSYLYQGINLEKLRETSSYGVCKNQLIELTTACTKEECEILYSLLQMLVQDRRRREMEWFALRMNRKKRAGRPRKSCCPQREQ